MPRVAALYRYPVKGFTPEECETLTVLDEGRIAGDRVLGIRFADNEAVLGTSLRAGCYRTDSVPAGLLHPCTDTRCWDPPC